MNEYIIILNEFNNTYIINLNNIYIYKVIKITN